MVRHVTPLARLSGYLAESEAKYRNLIELSPDAILIPQHGAIVFANPAAARLVGRPIIEIVDPGAGEDVEWNIAADLRGEESPITAVEILRPDGTTVTVQGRGARIPLRGRPAVPVVLPVGTEEKRGEAALSGTVKRLRNVLDLSRDAVYRFDLVADRFDYVRPVDGALTGIPLEEFVAFSLAEILDRIHADDRGTVEAVTAEAIGGERATVEYRFRLGDGNYCRFSDHFVGQTDENGRTR